MPQLLHLEFPEPASPWVSVQSLGEGEAGLGRTFTGAQVSQAGLTRRLQSYCGVVAKRVELEP